MMGYFYIFLTIAFTVYGQIVLKWQMIGVGDFPENSLDKILFLTRLLLNPWVISGFLAAFLASLAWMAAMTKLELSHAYPFMSLNFVFVIILSSFLFQETVTPSKIVGLGLIILGSWLGVEIENLRFLRRKVCRFKLAMPRLLSESGASEWLSQFCSRASSIQ
jgi:multidrug transporter EmrE-like cation transporter